MANITVDAYGYVKAGSDAFNLPPGSEVESVYNNRGDLLVAPSLPERAEIVRLGLGWGVAMTAATAFVPVAAWPTTRSELVLCNGEARGGKSYVIDRVWQVTITSITAAQPLTILGQIGVPGIAAIAAGTGLVHSLSGKGNNYTGNATWGVASTAFAIANHWFVLGTSLPITPVATNSMAGSDVPCYGRYIIPPGGSFNLAGVTSASTGTVVFGLEWFEVALALG